MVSCKHCSTPNSLDSTFCKRCGTALPEEDVLAAQEKLTALIAEGNTAFNEGRTDEAMAVAESACLSNPSSVPALSLKALCHERRGELAEALECADTIVDLNPDSELDKIKRNQLRTKLSVSVQLATQPPDRKTAFIGAVATVVIVVCVGFGLAKYANRQDSSKPAPGFVSREPANVPNPQQSNPSFTNPSPQSNPQPAQPQPQAQPQSTDNTGADRNRLRTPNPFEDFSNPGNISGPIIVQGDSPVKPTTPVGVNNGNVKVPTAPGPEKGSGDIDPAPRPENTKVDATQPVEPGIVNIEISKGGRKSFGGGIETNFSNAGGATAYDKVGRQKYQLGSYGPAAASFEQALRSGGDPITLNQWLGRCYDKLGRREEQIESYKRCVSACEAALSKGTGNKERVRAILDTCQQELKVLQGN